jgi:hypothetical protein
MLRIGLRAGVPPVPRRAQVLELRRVLVPAMLPGAADLLPGPCLGPEVQHAAGQGAGAGVLGLFETDPRAL